MGNRGDRPEQSASAPENAPRSTRAQRLDRWVREASPILFVGVILFLIATIGAAIHDGAAVSRWYDHRYNWRSHEYNRLVKLRAGFTLATFTAALGPPVFREVSDDRKWTESTFRGRGYWVQTVSRRDASTAVVMYSVTSCSTGFNPTFQLPDGTNVKLNRSTLASVQSDPEQVSADYFAPGATANAHFLEIRYGGNPDNYKSFAWGFDDACLNLPNWSAYTTEKLYKALPSGTFHGSVAQADPEVQRLRRRLPVNTYAETAPLAGFADVINSFQIGVNRLLVRTITNAVYRQPTQTASTPGPSGTDVFGRIYGPKRMRDVWRCLQSPLVLPSAFVTGGEEAITFGQVPERFLRYVGTRFVVLHSTFGRLAHKDQELLIFFAHGKRNARHVAQSLRQTEKGVVKRLDDVVLLWKRPPTQEETNAVETCLLEAGVSPALAPAGP
jgi:hypothetical protein